MGVIDAVAKKAKEVKEGVSSTIQEYSHLGDELKAKGQQMQTSPAPAAKPAAAPRTDSGKRYGDKPGEQRIDVREMLKPLPSYKKGTEFVPVTGPAILHKGEKVVTAEENKKSKPAKSIKEIRTRKTDDGKYVHTHLHHSPEHHPDEMHVSNNLKEAQQHLADNEGAMAPQAPPPPDADGGAAPTPGM